MEAIKTVNLTKKYKDVVAVDQLNLTIEQGELCALLGVNGAGKTTTVKMLSCLTSPTSGDAFLLGKSIRTQASAVKETIALSPQETAIAQRLSVKENLELMGTVYRLKKEEREERIAELAENLGLAEVLLKKAGSLSGGWQRRLSIAMALIADPQILFLDEPTLGLDVLARGELWELIGSLKGRVTVVLTTHYMEEAEALADRVAIMKDGRLLVCRSVDELKKQAKTDRFEQAFVRIVKGEV